VLHYTIIPKLINREGKELSEWRVWRTLNDEDKEPSDKTLMNIILYGKLKVKGGEGLIC
jgi:hypothetical protein